MCAFRHLSPIGHRVGRIAVVGVLSSGLTLTTVPAAQAAPSDWAVVAHRGGVVATPESTFAAMRYMLLRGVDSVELDIRFTREGAPVVMHDDLLDRTTDCTGSVRAISLARVKRCDAGSWFGAQFAGEPVPTLAKAFNYVGKRSKRVKFFLHMKTATAAEAAKIAKLVRKKKLTKRVVPIADSMAKLRRLEKAGLRKVGLVFNDPAGWSAGADYLIPYNVTSTPAVVAAAHGRGQIVYPVENKPHSAGALAGLDIDGILANDIDKVLILAGRLAPPPGHQFAGEPAAPEPTVIPEGEPRTTGPMDF